MKDSSFAESVEKKLAKANCKQIEYAKDAYYTHPTFLIEDLSDYISLVTAISSINKDTRYNKTVVFRGIADSTYSPVPGLSRIKNPYPDMEIDLINEFLTRRPDAFRSLPEFDILAKMQHYGLPTRLLDFSLNPLVALYFACESKNNKDGRVLCHNTFLQNDSFNYSNAICTTAVTKPFDSNYTVEEYFCSDKLSLHQYLIQSYLCGETTVVRPKYWNQRIANQAGVFMIFSNNLHDKYRGVLCHMNAMDAQEALQEYGRGKIDKDLILEIFPKEPMRDYIDDTSEYLSSETLWKMFKSYDDKEYDEGFWEKNKRFFENRFTVSDSLKAISQDIISNDFCSVIIEPKRKKKILQELSYIGIGADYIYPELEYTAQEIKRKYE